MKVEYKVTHSSRAQQYAHKYTMSAERGLSEWGLLCATGFHSQEQQWQVTKHGDMDSYCISEKQWEVCRKVWENYLNVSFCATFHLSTQLQKRKKYINGSDCNQKGRRQWKSLHLFPVLSGIDTSNTSRMTFTKSQSNRENANQVHRVLWRHKLRKELELNVRLKQLQKLLRK